MTEVDLKLLAKKFDDLVSEADPFGDRFSRHEVETIRRIWQTAIEVARQPIPEQCPVCGGDCAGANPPVMNCPMAGPIAPCDESEFGSADWRRNNPQEDI